MYFNTNISAQLLFDDSSQAANFDLAWEDIKLRLSQIDSKISVYNEQSDVYKFNNSDGDCWIEVSEETFKVFCYAKKVYLDTKGAYNPAVYLLSDLWGFTDRFMSDSFVVQKPYDRENYKQNLPEQKYIDAFLKLTNFDEIKEKQEGTNYYLFKPSTSIFVDGVKYTMQIDLGGIGKGYACNEIKSILTENEIYRGYISMGSSSIVALERSEKEVWNIKYRHPRKDGDYYLSSNICDVSISTSGDYENYYEYGGVRYCHIINPFNGYPITTNIITSTMIMDDAAYADAYTTALCVMGKDKAIDFIKSLEKNKEIMCAFVYFDAEINQYTLYKNASYEVLDSTMQVKEI